MTVQTHISSETAATGADVFRDGRFEPDGWVRLADDAPIPADGRVLLSVGRLKAEAANGSLGNAPLGVVIEPADRIEDVAPHVGRLSVIAINFPKFSDGRGFSHAARIARLGFDGELRAIGNVLIDQISHMRRVGFTAFQVSHGVTRRYLAEGRDPAPRLYYQPAVRIEVPAGTRPWQRRAG